MERILTESSIITPQQMQSAMDAEPAEILRAIHKRIVDTEKLMRDYRNFAMNQQTDIEMLQERVTELRSKVESLESPELPREIKHDLQIEMFDLA
jgi:hypothetical protein